jgi:nucleoside-diphosphate-sugar epimerase
MKIAVSGGGYVGSVILEDLLKQGYDVVCMDNFHKTNCDHLFRFIKDYKNFEFMCGDINHIEDVRRFTKDASCILNTASIVGFPACEKYQVLAKTTHYDGIKNMLTLMPEDCGFIQFSTDSCYGFNDDFCTEETKLNPQSLYGETKAKAEELVLSRSNKSVVLRFSTGMGVSNVMRCNLLVNDLTYQAVKTKRLDVFEPKASRSFINVKDMSSAAIHFMNLLLSGHNRFRIYNVGHDELNYTKGELVELISKKTGCSFTFTEGKDPDCRNYKISHQRQYESGFTPSITMEETIEDLIRAIPLIEWQKKYQ